SRGRSDRDHDSCTDSCSVGFSAFQFELYPMIGIAGVKEQNAPVVVARIRSADHCIDILSAVIVEVGKTNTMPLLQMTRPRSGSHVLEVLACCVAKHSIGD